MRVTLVAAAAYNILGGVGILLLLPSIAPIIHFDPTGPALFRMFAGGTAVLFGIAYLAVCKDYRRNRPLLVCGTALKLWAFAISVFGYVTSALSWEVLLLFGVGNLMFAVLFTRCLLAYRIPK